MRIDLVQGTPFGVAVSAWRLSRTPSGPAIGSLVAGIASIFVGLTVSCFGLAGAAEGWGARRRRRVHGPGGVPRPGRGRPSASSRCGRSAGAGRLVTGRGMAITGLVLGSVGAGIGVLSLLAAFLIAGTA